MFAMWTLVVWVGRVRNIAADAGLDAGEKWRALVPAVIFTVLGLGVAWLAVATPPERLVRRTTAIAALFTVGYWLVRAVLIALNDHSLGFVAVHTVLALISTVAAGWAWRVVDRGEPCEADGSATDEAAPTAAESSAATVSAGPEAGGS